MTPESCPCTAAGAFNRKHQRSRSVDRKPHEADSMNSLPRFRGASFASAALLGSRLFFLRSKLSFAGPQSSHNFHRIAGCVSPAASSCRFETPQRRSQQQQRCKHSTRQKKRMANHPARLRVLAKLNRIRGSPAVTSSPSAPPPVPVYPKVFEPEVLTNGWSAPPENQQEIVGRYPFRIERTKNKPRNAVGFLPVYSCFRKDGTGATTRIKKVTGDVGAFLREMRASVPATVQTSSAGKGGDDSSVRRRVGGTIEVKGNHVRAVKLWLASLGF